MTDTDGMAPEFSRPEFSRPEFSRRVSLADIERHDLHSEWTASAAECAALARRFGVVAVHALAATADLSRLGGGGALARITFTAEVEQQSVLSLANVRQPVDAAVTVRYLTEKKAREYDLMMEEEGVEPPDEDIEVLDGETIDIGETIAQQLSLALDPYPRQVGETFEAVGISSDDDDRADRPNPFEVLKNFKETS
jgi:uncharacterized metal-binding protein YceD (DUF177 family)